jgi:CheY-like chemotaxis protein
MDCRCGTLGTIGARLRDGEVADAGNGMDEKTPARVFEPCFSTKGDRSTGLGLSTVWGMVQRMGGRVDLDSRLAAATTFVLRVPAIAASAPAGTAPKGTKTEEGLEILVVDDEPNVLEILTPMLAGNEVTTAPNGQAAIQRLAKREFDLVLCDWIMGGVSGLEVAEAAKRRRSRTVVVLMTGWELKDTPADRHPAIDRMLPNPFDHNEIDRVLAEATVLFTGGR